LTSDVVDLTSTSAGLTSTMDGWTFAAIDQASMTLLDWATRRATARKASAPMGAHLALLDNMRQANKATKWQQTFQACPKSLGFFWDSQWKYNMGRRPARGNTWFWQIHDGVKKIRCHRRW
jgi:hypothetical protein